MRRPRASRPPGGFTFIELMVVLAILAFAFTYAILHLDGATGEARLASAARQLGSTFEFCRGHAIQSNRYLEVHIDMDRREWTTVLPPRPSESELERRDQEEVLATEPALLPEWIRIDGIQIDGDTTRSGGVLVVSFSPTGEIVPNGFMVRLSSEEIADPERARFSVEVNGLTGEVSYVQGLAPFDQVVRGDGF